MCELDSLRATVVRLIDAAGLSVAAVGGKAATLARLATAGFAVPPGVVVTAGAWPEPATGIAAEILAALQTGELAGAGRFAVRSSAAAEDLSGASYAGQYETFLDVPTGQVVDAVGRCRRAAAASRVAAYRSGRDQATDPGDASGIAVLVQPMVAAAAAGVVFTANPLTGDRAETVVNAVTGVGERLVGGEAVGDQWSVRDGTATAARTTEDAITAEQAVAVAALAAAVERQLGGPQDIEWALEAAERGGRLVLLQARPMTALPEPIEWVAPGPGLWMRNFRLGEWLPDPLTPLFADWLFPLIEDGYLDGMRDSTGAVIAFRYAVVNGWYFNAVPVPSPRLLVRALTQSRGRIIRILYNALFRVSRDPVAADRAVLGRLHRRWRDEELPGYRRLVETGQRQVQAATSEELIEIVDRVGRSAGRQLWFLAIVGGSAWKMEACLTRFADRHLPQLTGPSGVLADGVQVLLRGLPGIDLRPAPHAVISADWYWPVHADGSAPVAGGTADWRQRLVDQREAAEAACLAALAASPRRRRQFTGLLEVIRRYTTIREAQARDLTLGWPLLRTCVVRLGDRLVAEGSLDRPDQVFFLTSGELHATTSLSSAADTREASWQRQRRQPAPLTVGTPPRLIGDPILRAVKAARGDRPIPAEAIIGQPASAGRATGQVRVITDPADFASFRPGEVLVARSTAPAWTPLFADAAAVVTDGGAITAHASIVAREYGIPAVVGTGDATHRLITGQFVIVDGTAGTVTRRARGPGAEESP